MDEIHKVLDTRVSDGHIPETWELGVIAGTGTGREALVGIKRDEII